MKTLQYKLAAFLVLGSVAILTFTSPPEYRVCQYCRQEPPVTPRVLKSSIHGRGTFAERPYAKDVSLYVPGHIVPADQATEHSVDLNGFTFIPNKPFCLINHSDTPNCEFAWDADGLWLTTLQPLSEGEEITVCYGFQP